MSLNLKNSVSSFSSVCTLLLHLDISYTIPMRTVSDLLPEPKGGSNKSHAARGRMAKLRFKAYYGIVSFPDPTLEEGTGSGEL